MKIENFISDHVTFRKESLLKSDYEKLQTTLSIRLNDKSLLVIGGAGTIGSSYIKAILKYRINKLVVVDINAHSLTQLKRDLRNSKEYHRPVEFITYQIIVNDRVFEDIFLYQGPFDIVANFAQLKHLANENDLLSVETIIENNIFVTRKLLEILYETPPKHSLKYRACPEGVSSYYLSPIEAGELCFIATVMGVSGDIFFPKLDELGDSITFDQIAIDLIRSQGFEPDVCISEDEAREKAASLREGGTTTKRHCDLEERSGKQPPNNDRLLHSVRNDDHKSVIANDEGARQSVAYPIYFFGSDTSGEKSFEEFFTEKEVLGTVHL